MTENVIGLKQVNVRRKWKNEEHDFTPWLARNLEFLGDELDLKLKLEQTEKPVGPFFLDILAAETMVNAKVAIENQLAETDHSHLGQLLTYAAGCDAQIAVWVATEFQYEHAEALYSLNDLAGSKLKYYGMKLEVYESACCECLLPKLRKVVGPGFWDKNLTLQSGAMSTRKKKYHEFFQKLRDGMADAHTFPSPTILYDESGRLFRSQKDSRIGYAVYLEEENYAWVTLHITAENTEQTKDVFDRLRTHSCVIEKAVQVGPDPVWYWNRANGKTFSSVSVRKNGTINDLPSELDDTMKWMRENLSRFRDFFDNRLDELLNC